MDTIEIPVQELHLVGWDDSCGPGDGPVAISYFVTDKDEQWFIHPDNIRVVGATARIGERYLLAGARARSDADPGSGTWLNTARHRIPFIRVGSLLQVPICGELNEVVLRALRIAWQDLEVMPPRRVVRCVYVERPEADLIMHRLAVYFYLFSCQKLAEGDRKSAGCALRRMMNSGPVFPHAYLLAVAYFEQEKYVRLAPAMLESASATMRYLGLRNNAGTDDLEKAAWDLYSIEMEERRSLPTGDRQAIAKYVALKCGVLSGTKDRQWLDLRRTARQILDADH